MHNEVSKKKKIPSPTLLFILYIEWWLVFMKKKHTMLYKGNNSCKNNCIS